MTSVTQTQIRTNTLLWGFLAVFGVALLGVFYVRPQISAWQLARARAEAKAADVQALQMQIAEIDQATVQLEQRKPQIDQLNIAVPTNAGSDNLMVLVEALARDAAVTFSSAQPALDDAGQVEFTLNLTGPYSGIRRFLELLDQAVRPTRVTSLTLNRAADLRETSLINATVTLHAASASAGESGEGVAP